MDPFVDGLRNHWREIIFFPLFTRVVDQSFDLDGRLSGNLSRCQVSLLGFRRGEGVLDDLPGNWASLKHFWASYDFVFFKSVILAGLFHLVLFLFWRWTRKYRFLGRNSDRNLAPSDEFRAAEDLELALNHVVVLLAAQFLDS